MLCVCGQKNEAMCIDLQEGIFCSSDFLHKIDFVWFTNILSFSWNEKRFVWFEVLVNFSIWGVASKLWLSKEVSYKLLKISNILQGKQSLICTVTFSGLSVDLKGSYGKIQKIFWDALLKAIFVNCKRFCLILSLGQFLE